MSTALHWRRGGAMSAPSRGVRAPRRQRLAVLPALLLAMVLMGVPRPAESQTVIGGILQLQVWGGFLMTTEQSRTESESARLTPTGAQTWCNDRGATVAADASATVNNNIGAQCDAADFLCTAIIDGDATPPVDNRQYVCAEQEPQSVVGRPSSLYCTYRWRYGFFDMFSEIYGDESMLRERGVSNPGTCYFKGLYILNYDQTCNNYLMYQPWNGTGPTIYPRGMFHTVIGARASSVGVRMDTTLPIANNDPNPLTSYRTYCHYQDYPLPAGTTTRMPQPPIIKGYKDLTWAQEHWWVIYLIIVIVLLLLLLLIIIYCTVTSVKPAEEPPVHLMVYRERSGRLYGELDEEDTMKSNSRSLDVGSRGRRSIPGDQDRSLHPFEDYSGAHWGAGEEPPMDPEDALRGTPRIFSQEDTMLTGDGDSFADTGNTSSSNGSLVGEEEDDDDDDATSADTTSHH